jgi:His/Glu/Gln/Arg/opine family amino acid ABC transporter permease subunit
VETLQLFAFGADGWGDELAEGAWLTLRLAVVSLGFGVVIGLLGAGAKLSQSRVLRAIAELYTTLIRGIPELLIIMIVFFGGSFVLQEVFSWFGRDEYVEVNGFAAGVFALSIVFGAFATEVFRGAFQAIPIGQVEAARACGMNRWLVFRRIQLPQVWRFALPGLGNLWLILIKDTTLVSVIAYDELIRKAQIAVGATKQPFTFFAVAAVIYLLLTIVSMQAIGRMEQIANRGVRRA